MLVQPGAVGGKCRVQVRDETPKPGAVIEFDEMGNFMGGDVIHHGFRGHDQTPRKFNIAGGGTTAPAAFGIANADPTDRSFDLMREMRAFLRQKTVGGFGQTPPRAPGQMVDRPRDVDMGWRQAKGRVHAPAGPEGTEDTVLTQNGNDRPRLKRDGGGHAGALGRNPCGAACQKHERPIDRGTDRHDQFDMIHRRMQAQGHTLCACAHPQFYGEILPVG